MTKSTKYGVMITLVFLVSLAFSPIYGGPLPKPAPAKSPATSYLRYASLFPVQPLHLYPAQTIVGLEASRFLRNSSDPAKCTAGDVEYNTGSSTFKGCSPNNTWGAFGGGGGGSGTVTSIATTGPISGGTITTTGTISCPTCTTGTPTSTQLVVGSGTQALGSLAGSVVNTSTGTIALTATAITRTPLNITSFSGSQTASLFSVANGTGSADALVTFYGNGLGSFTPGSNPAVLHIHTSAANFPLIFTNPNSPSGAGDLHFQVYDTGTSAIWGGGTAASANAYNSIAFNSGTISFSSTVPPTSGVGYFFDSGLSISGSSSGSAAIGVAAAAGTPSTILLPTTDPTNGQVITAGTPSGGKVQTSWSTVSGSSGISGLSANCIPKAATATTLTSCSAIDDAASTITSTEPIVAPSFTASGSGAGYFQCAGGTAPGGVANNIQVICPATVSGTDQLTLPDVTADTFTLNAATQTLTGKSIAGSEINSSTVGNTYGGTGLNSSASTGVAQVSSGTWSVSTALASGTTATTQSQLDGSTKVSTTAYVDTAVSNAVAGVNPAVAVAAATTQASDTSTYVYSNGVAGVGATLTGPTTNTAVTIDGFTFTALGQRLLVKNDTQSPSGAFNGIYSLTTLQTVAVKPVLTRALDYDQPSDINSTGFIPVVNGTANAGTSWYITSTVATIGTDPLTYQQGTVAAASIVTQASNASSGQVCTYTGANKVCVPATALPNGVTATTQSAGDNSTKVASTAYVDGTVVLTRSIGYAFGDAVTGSALTTSEVGYVTVDAPCTIVGWHIMLDAGTATVKTWRVNGGTALPTVSNSISTSGVAISTGTKIDSTTVTDFTSVTLAANDTLGFSLSAVATAKQLTFQLKCQHSGIN